MLRNVVRAGFHFAAAMHLMFGKALGHVYTRLWPTLGISYFEHEFDYARGPQWNSWAERGFLGRRIIPQGGAVLDIACGDGFYDAHFFIHRAACVEAIDLDSEAIRIASRRYRKIRGLTFRVADALKYEPPQKFDVVFLFGAIEHFSEADGHALLEKVKLWLKPRGIFLGSTPIFTERGGHNFEHQNEFTSRKQIEDFLGPHFSQIEYYSPVWEKNLRQDCYFYCRA